MLVEIGDFPFQIFLLALLGRGGRLLALRVERFQSLLLRLLANRAGGIGKARFQPGPRIQSGRHAIQRIWR